MAFENLADLCSQNVCRLLKTVADKLFILKSSKLVLMAWNALWLNDRQSVKVLNDQQIIRYFKEWKEPIQFKLSYLD